MIEELNFELVGWDYSAISLSFREKMGYLFVKSVNLSFDIFF